MKKLIVPKSVRARARRAMAARFLKLAIYLFIAYVIADFIYLELTETNFGNLSTTIFLIMIIPFWRCGIPAKLFDSDWVGEIISIDTKNTNKDTADSSNRAAISQTALVKLPNGKLHSREIFDEGQIFFASRDKIYRVGDKVLHVYGTDYIRPLNTLDKTRPIVCVVCGYKSPCDSKSCQHCGCSLDIKIID